MPRKRVNIANDALPSEEFPKLKGLRIQPPLMPMEARSQETIPSGKEWIYEPKWDGFRCVAFRSGEEVVLQSKAGQPLGRYFPEIVAALAKLSAKKFVLDGELVIESSGHLDFNALLQRIHPAESRVLRLAKETPARYLVFDMLAGENGEDVSQEPLRARKKSLESFAVRNFRPAEAQRFFQISQYSDDLKDAEAWMKDLAAYGCDGVVAKLAAEPYHAGDREAMVKVKRQRTADCVVGGFRYASKKEKGVGSLLLGLYAEHGELHHVGFCSSFSGDVRLELLKRVKPLMGGAGFTGRSPGARAAGAERMTDRANGSGWTPSWWWKCNTITFPGDASGMEQSFCAGDRRRALKVAHSNRYLTGINE